MKALRRIWAVLKKETLHIMRDKVVFSVCFVASVFLSTLMGLVYEQGKVTNVPIVIYDGDKSDLSRMLINGFKDSEKLNIVKYADSFEELKNEIDSQRAEGGIFIPQDMKKKVKSGQSQEIAVILNGNNSLIMNAVATSATQVIQTFSAGINIKVMAGNGIASKKATQTVQSLSTKTRIWYNPTGDYGAFMLLGLTGTVLQQLALLGVALSFARERESGAWKNLVFSKLKSKEIIFGKFIIYFMIFFINSIITHSIAINYFNLPQKGNLNLLLLIMAVFIGAVLTLGIFISALIKSQVQAIQTAMLLAVPSYVLSGYTWPVFNMPLALQKISYALPLTHFLKAMKGVMYMNQGYDAVKGDINFLIGLIVLFLPINILLVERRMKKG